MEKSDTGIVAMKRANAASGDAGERVERRTVIDGKTGGETMSRMQDREIMPSGAERIRQAARRKPKEKLTTLLHHISPETLGTAFDALKREAAPGVDGVTWEEYEEGREARLRDLHDRVHRGAYRAKPVRRVNIPKPDGGTRPLGVAALEDKILQRAMVDTILTPIYELEFLGFSHGFRPGRGAHDALDTLAYGIMRRKTNWIVDADVRKYFDRIDRDWLIQFLEHRIGDKRVLRLIRKWLNAGVMDADKQADTGQGTPQGAVISPLLANVYLHYVLDLWFAKQWRPQEAEGETFIVRYADDFVLGFQHRREAERFLGDLRERLAKFGLELHPEKTRLLEFGRFAVKSRSGQGKGKPETFEFLGFTHYCGKTRAGRFKLGRKPIAKRMRRKLQAIKEVLRKRMHEDIYAVGRWLGQVLQGWLNYYAVPHSYRFLKQFKKSLKRLWLRILRRRSQKDRFSWEKLQALSQKLWPSVRILHTWPDERFVVKHRR